MPTGSALHRVLILVLLGLLMILVSIVAVVRG